MPSLLSRKRDLFYFIFFVLHIPTVLYPFFPSEVVDLYPFWPSSIRPAFMQTLRDFHLAQNHDRFFMAPPAWFNCYLWMELLYHLPLSVYAIGALRRNDPKLPIHLLIYAVQTAITTATCVADYLSWDEFSSEEKLKLTQLYGPYLAISVFMGVDMFARLDSVVGKNSRSGAKKNK